MKVLEKDTLKQQYKIACDNYLFAFCEKHEYDFDEAGWVADRPCEMACIGDYFADMPTIIDDIDLDAPKEEFPEWYDYTLELGILGVTELPNFRSWVKGCPRMSEDDIAELRVLHQKAEDAKRIFEALLNRFNNLDNN